MLTRFRFRSLSIRFFISLIVLVNLLSFYHPAFAAGSTVGTGTSASCTEAAFDTALNAVQLSGGGTITFNCGSAPVTILFSTQKEIYADVTLNGNGKITLSGNNATPLFQVFSAQSLTLTGITLTRGYGHYGAIENFGVLNIQNSQLTNNIATGSGGAVANHGELSVTNAIFADNSAADKGGGIFSDGSHSTITDSQFLRNTGAAGGGGIAVTSTISMTVTGGQFTGNKTTDTFGQGGGIYSEGTTVITGAVFTQNSSSRGGGLSVMTGATTVSNSQFTGNWGAYGGGIRQEGGDLKVQNTTFSGNGYSPSGTKINTGGGALSWGNGTAALTNVTISGNWASYGGGADQSAGTTTWTNVTLSGNAAVGGGAIDQGGGSITLINATVTNNTAPFSAGGIANRGGTITLTNTLMAGNLNPDNQNKFNCYQPVANHTFSLSSDSTCGFGVGRDNQALPLGSLGYNGGPTKTHLLMSGNPAIDSGTGLGCPENDQRGVMRPQGQACDVGAVEVTPADLSLKLYLPVLMRN